MKHLLVVEDNKIAGSLISTKVSHALPLKIHWAQSLAEARELLDKNNNNFFAALLDYVLPDAEDGEVIDEVVARGIPSIVFTGNVLTQQERLRIETHICVYQTTADLVDLGVEVHVVADAVSSRTAENKAIGLQKMRDAGARLTSVETALFELLKVAEGEPFKEILRIVK